MEIETNMQNMVFCCTAIDTTLPSLSHISGSTHESVTAPRDVEYLTTTLDATSLAPQTTKMSDNSGKHTQRNGEFTTVKSDESELHMLLLV